MKNIFHLFVLINLTVNLYCVGVVNKGYYLVYTSSFSSSELQKIKDEVKKTSDIAFGQSGQPSALCRINESDKEGKEIIIECDKSVEKVKIFSEGIASGKIKKIGYFNFDGEKFNIDNTEKIDWLYKYRVKAATETGRQ